MELDKILSFSAFITALKQAKRKGRSEYSYEELASKIGYCSARSLAMVRLNRRAPSANMVRCILNFLELSNIDREFIHLLAEKSRKELKGLDTRAIENKLNRYRSICHQTRSTNITPPGVQVHFDSTTPAYIQRQISGYLRELAAELALKQTSNPPAPHASEQVSKAETVVNLISPANPKPPKTT